MQKRKKHIGVAAAIMGFFAVAFGAFGAHALKSILDNSGGNEIYELANQYHFIHTLALLALISSGDKIGRWKFFASVLLVAGTLLFSGSLYLYAVFQIREFALITPIGGLLLLSGWSLVVIHYINSDVD